ncbi:MAG: hypothetical protein ACRCWW_14400 [Scandinavium sp.]|uniref:hypothetical protein n=1 Tax=Scandinavium sp. TaxID=2830653 RepID=UPI003F2BC8AF
MRRESWESWEEAFVREVGTTMPIPMIAEKLERSPRAIQCKAGRLNVKLDVGSPGRPWTEAEVFLFGRFTPEEIATATGRSIYSVRSKRNLLARASGGKIMSEWTAEELALLWRHNNATVAEMTGRSIEEIAERRLQANSDRNNWPEFDPEREDS